MNTFLSKFKTIAASALISASFIGPGVITSCAVSGASFGYSLLWAVLFSAISAIVLQEMAVRLGASTKKDFCENIRVQIKPPILKFIAVFIVLICVILGNTAFEIGNLAGTTLALNSLIPNVNIKLLAIVSAVLVLVLVFTNGYKKIKDLFSIAILLMGLGFFVTAIVVKPNLLEIFKGLFVPSMPNTDEAWICIVSLVGTTVVPYNIFLYAYNAADHNDTKQSIKSARFDNIASVALSAAISVAIVICSVVAFHGNKTVIVDGTQLAMELSPTLGELSTLLFSLGFFCASFSAAIVAPVCAINTISGILGYNHTNRQLNENVPKVICILILLFSAGVCTFFYHSPISLILFAQVVNAVILPMIVITLIFTANSKQLGYYRNTAIANILSIIIFLITMIISYRGILLIIHKWQSM